MEEDIPDYDMDSEDEMWIKAQSKKLELTPLKVCVLTKLFYIIIYQIVFLFYCLFTV